MSILPKLTAWKQPVLRSVDDAVKYADDREWNSIMLFPYSKN